MEKNAPHHLNFCTIVIYESAINVSQTYSVSHNLYNTHRFVHSTGYISRYMYYVCIMLDKQEMNIKLFERIKMIFNKYM